MSLRVWLPLTGDLNNQGLSNITVANNGATLNAVGKLGSCYSFDGSEDYIALTGNTFYNIIKGSNQPFSIAMWIYHADATRAILFGDFGLSGAINFNIELTTSHTLRFYWNGSPDVAPGAAVISQSTWAHAAFVYNGSSLQFYVNGELKYTWSGTLAAKTKSSGSYYLGRDSRTGTTVLNGRLNDFRLYDHALSVKEVEELARGLVLHYKLSDPSVEGTTNLCSTGASGWNNSGTCVRTANDTSILFPPTKSNTYSIRATSDGNMAAQIGLTPASHPSKTIVASTWVWLDGTQDSSSFYLRSVKTDGSVGYLMYQGQSNPIFWPQRQWVRIATDPIATAADATTFYICTYVNKNTEVRAFNGWQIEAKDHPTAWTPPGTTRAAETRMCDCSGYKHHGTAVDLGTSSSTARYTASSRFPESASSILIGNLSAMLPEGIFTFNVWFKKVTGEWSSKNYETILGGPSGFELEAKSGGTNSPYLVNYNWSPRTNMPYELDRWNMVTMTRNATETKFYLNGVLQVTAAAGSIPSGNYYLGAWRDANTQNYRGYMSDARIYATVLTDKQIMELYNESAAIDRSGTYYTRELIEQ